MIHQNQFINIQISTLKWMLFSFLKKLESRRDWIAPLGILMSLLLSLVASDFKQFAGLSGDNWQGIVITLAIFSFFWLLHSLIQAYNSITIDDFINKLNDSMYGVENCRILYFLKNKDEKGIWRLLVMYSPVYECDMLPYTRKSEGKLGSEGLKFIISQKLMTAQNNVLLEHMDGLSMQTLKPNLHIDAPDHFFFEFYLVKFLQEDRAELLHKNFKLNGINYSWKTVEELTTNLDGMKKNGDVIHHINDHYVNFFSNEIASSFSSILVDDHD